MTVRELSLKNPLDALSSKLKSFLKSFLMII